MGTEMPERCIISKFTACIVFQHMNLLAQIKSCCKPFVRRCLQLGETQDASPAQLTVAFQGHIQRITYPGALSPPCIWWEFCPPATWDLPCIWVPSRSSVSLFDARAGAFVSRYFWTNRESYPWQARALEAEHQRDAQRGVLRGQLGPWKV